MSNLVLQWVQKHADNGALIAPRGPLRFALRLVGLVILSSEIAISIVHVIWAELGWLPAPLGEAMRVAVPMTFIVAATVGFALSFSVGLAIRDLAINRNDFRRLSATDDLSGLLNRRAFFEAMAGTPEAPMILFDIDRFKTINDRLGHVAGDAVIRDIGHRLAHGAAEAGIHLGRLGGEEFGVLLPGRTLAEAFEIAEMLRCSVADHPFATKFETIPVTISGGVAAPMADDGPDDMYRRCDEALYAAKRSGRNRMMTYDETQALEPLRACG